MVQKYHVQSNPHERRPTPNPLIRRPNIIVQNPVVKVWIKPPIVNTTAPTKRVPLRPIRSPTRPAAMEVAGVLDQQSQ